MMEIIKGLELQFEYKFWTYYGTMEEMFTQNILNKENASIEYVFNELGKDGWELFTILQGKENCLFIFKRSKWVEKKAQEEQEEQADGSWNKEYIEELQSHIDGIRDKVDRMTSGNFMHSKAAIKFSANTIEKVLSLMGIVKKGE